MAVFATSIEVSAPPVDVFGYFTDASLLVEWIGNYAVLDAQPGGEFTLDIEGIPVRGRYVIVDAPNRVVVTWGHAGSTALPVGSTEVEFSLTPTSSGGTVVRVEHRNLPDEQLSSHKAGWPMFFGRLGSLLG